VYASEGFCSFTKYTKEEIEGRNCRFLQGPGTDKEDVKKVREAIEGKKDVSLQLLNYRKDGSTFINQVSVYWRGVTIYLR
jgi:PAS domain S-box-containing protein